MWQECVQALRFYEGVQAAQATSNGPQLWARMAECQAALGQPASATAVYETALAGALTSHL